MTVTVYITYTQHAKELVTKQSFQNQRFEAYSPQFKKFDQHTWKIEEKVIPLLSCYILAGISSIKAKKYVSHIACLEIK